MPTSAEPSILAEGLVKRFGHTQALAGLDLRVDPGSVLGVLGPNGAGKTTAVRVLTTLLRPDAGRARVAGFDVVHDASRLRAKIGLTGQYTAVDEYLTGRENLEMVGRLYHLGKLASRRRADELIEQFDLVEASGRPVKTYSGGMRRRLDLAASLIAAPPVLFLDEPTTGLDPRGRRGMWSIIADLVTGGTTLLLTTQYLDEADALADRIAVIDGGRVIAEGTADELKSQIGGDRFDLVIPAGADFGAAVAAVRPHLSGEPALDPHERRISGPAAHGARQLAALVRDLDSARIDIADLSLHRPSLDDVFLALTGRHAAAEGSSETAPAALDGRRGRSGRRRSA